MAAKNYDVAGGSDSYSASSKVSSPTNVKGLDSFPLASEDPLGAPHHLESFPASVLAAAKRARTKFDLIVVPFVTIFYFLNFLDRANIGNARTSGLQADLNMTNHQYSVALTVTYVPYIVFELPSNLLLKRLGPNVLLPLYVSLWGVVTTFQGFVTNYSGLLACRFLLGLCESGLLPGILLYISSFYRRNEMQFRMAILFTATSLAGAFSGLLAYAIAHLDGKGGKAGWSWIFFLEGAVTSLFGIFSFFFLPSSSSTAKFLTPEEQIAVISVLKADMTAEEEHEPFSWTEVGSTFTTPQLMMMVPAYFANGATLYGLAYFAPTIINSLGYSPIRSQLFSVPPYACAFGVSLVMALMSDKFRARGLVTIVSALIAIAGFGLFLGSSNKHVEYGALFLQVTGAYISAPALGAWNANNLMPHYRRATGFAIALTMTNAGGILSTWIFTDPPRFKKASIINLVFSIVIAISALINTLWLNGANKRKAKDRILFASSSTAAEKEDDTERRRLGDRHRDFVYTL